jgi:thioredoxin 1
MHQITLTELTDETFTAETGGSDVPVLVGFYSERDKKEGGFGRIFERLAEECQGRMRFCRAEVARNQRSTRELGVTRTPSFFLFKEGELMERIVGPVTGQVLQVMIGRYF